MGQLSEMTLEKAAAMVAVRAKIGHVKRAAGEAPGFLDKLRSATFDLQVPEIGANAATGMGAHSDPGWAAYRDSLLGAGAGAGLGAVTSLFSSDKEKKKRWMQRMLQGGLLGGAAVGGFSAAARYGNVFANSQASSVKPEADLEAARVRNDAAISRGQQPAPADVELIKNAPDNPVTAVPRAGTWDRFRTGWDNIWSGDKSRAWTGVNQIVDSPWQGAGAGAAGYAVGSVADRMAVNRGVDARVRTMPVADMRAAMSPVHPYTVDERISHIRANGLPPKGAKGPVMVPPSDVKALRAHAPPGASKKFRILGTLLGAAIPQFGGRSTPHQPPAGVPPLQ